MQIFKEGAGWILRSLVISFIAGMLVACLSPTAQLQGSYTAIITEEEMPTGFGFTNLSPDDVALFAAEWQLNFLPDGIFTATRNGETMIEEGHYTVNGSLVTVGQETGPASCVGPPPRVEEPGTYQWSRRTGQLIFLPVDDKCGGRLIVFSAVSWTKVK